MRKIEFLRNYFGCFWRRLPAAIFVVIGAWRMAAGDHAMAQVSPSEAILTKGLMYNQTSQTTPVQATQNAAILEANIPGLGGPGSGYSGILTLPNHSTVSPSYDSTDIVFFFAATNNTTAGLDTSYPSGQYSLIVTSQFLHSTNTANLPADNFPTAPQFTNYTAAQAIDPTQNFSLLFQIFAGATLPDDSIIKIFNNAGSLVLSNTVALGSHSFQIPKNTLTGGQTYSAHLRFRQLATNSGTYFPTAVGFFSETVMPIVTTGSQNQTPPALTNYIPAMGQIATATSPLTFQFNQAMDQTASIQWSETINGSAVPFNGNNIVYYWANSSTLTCYYGTIGGTWPGGAVFSWALNTVTNASSNFTSTAGIQLPCAVYSGSFSTPGGPWSCNAQTNDTVEAPAFYIVKAVDYVETGPGAPVPDPSAGGQLLTFFGAPANGSLSSPPLVMIQPPPSALPAPGGLVLAENETLADVSAGRFDFRYNAPAAGAADLDNTYPAGSYSVEMATTNSGGPQLPPIPTNSVSLTVASGSYPPVPQFTNSTVIPLSNVTNSFTISWLPWTGGSISSYISFQIVDASSNVVFSAPNLCSNLALSVASTSIVIPANTLSNGVQYQVVLSFLSLSDNGEYMPGIPGAGYAALASVTRMNLSAYMSPPPVITITSPAAGSFLPSGTIAVHVTASQPHGYLTGLQLFSGTTSIASLPLGAGISSYNGTILGTIQPGPQNLSVVATDTNGQTSTAGPVSIMAQSPNFHVTLASPAPGATYPPYSAIPLGVGASSPTGAITNVSFFVDGDLVASVTSPPFASAALEVPPGVHQITAQAFDAVGNGGTSSSVFVTVQAPAKDYMALFASTNGTLSFGFTGNASSGYVLQAASSLNQTGWQPIQTKIISGAAAVFSDANYSSYDARFYRVAPLTNQVGSVPAFSVLSHTDAATAVSDMCSAFDNALISLTNSNGAVFNLTIPGAAIGLSQPVTMMSVSNLQDYPFAGAMIGAVEIAPSELDLFTPATLIIQLPTNVSASSVAAFSYHVPNGELYLAPFTVTNVVVGNVTNAAISIPVNRFGGYGIAALTQSDLALTFPKLPSDPADSLDQAVALYTLQTTITAQVVTPKDKPVTRGGPSGPSKEQLVQQLLDQFDTVYAQMQAAESSGQTIPCQMAEWQRWIQAVYAANEQDEFSTQLAEFAQALATIYQNGITKSIAKANSTHDWSTITKLLLIDTSGNLYSVAVQQGWQPGQVENLQEALDNCLTFELDFDTSIENDNSVGTEISHITTQVTFQEGNPAKTGQLKGSAPVDWQQATFPPIPKCSTVIATPNAPNFDVYGIAPGGTSTKNDNCSTTYNVTFIASAFWPGVPFENFSTTCQGYPVQLPSFWWAEFGVIYKDTLRGYPKHGAQPTAAYVIQDGWQTQGGGGNPVLATRQGNKVLHLKDATITETSNWTLKHTPQ